MWVRGLKLSLASWILFCVVSHPMWVRGLKLRYACYKLGIKLSHPMWVRGLKLNDKIPSYIARDTSHPMWVRGLKLRQRVNNLKFVNVAPHVGAWIETTCHFGTLNILLKSHPMWVRGLKRCADQG